MKQKLETDIEKIVERCAALKGAAGIEADAGSVKANPLAAALKRAGLQVVVIDRAPVYNKATLLHGLYQNTPFPGYFGFNWDALQDTLADFSWLKEQPAGIALILTNNQRFKADAPEDWETFLDIIHAVNGIWAKKRKLPFHLVTLVSQQ